MSDSMQKINDLVELGNIIRAYPMELEEAVMKSVSHNAWFTIDSVRAALTAIANQYLDKDALTAWSNNYPDNISTQKSIGLILAGNIPLVGFHDVLSVFLSGHIAKIKLSDKDKFLLPYLVSQLCQINENYISQFEWVERLENFDAVIATGSNSSGSYFEKYFGHVPHIIRKNRHAVAVLYNDTSDEDLKKLGDDVFAYYGLGCRNVASLFLEKDFDLNRLFKAFEEYHEVNQHNKYMNNYDYNNAMFLLNEESFLTNNFIILKESEDISSRIATLHYTYFKQGDDLCTLLRKQEEKIQCIISDRPLNGQAVIAPGKAQSPALDDYADGVDTMAFLNSL